MLAQKKSVPPLVDNPPGSTTCLSQIQEIQAFANTSNIARTERYRAQNVSASILYEYAKTNIDDPEKQLNFHKTIKCLRIRKSSVSIHKSVKHQKSFYSGLVVCGSPWACPVCAAKIQNRRAIEIQAMFKWSYQTIKKQVVMVTFTYPHGISDDLSEMMKKHTKALEFFRSGNSYTLFKKRIGYEGFIRSLEITHGLNGWHPHTHELFIIDQQVDEEETKKYICNRWEKSCIKAGLLDASNKIQVIAFRKHSTDVIFNAKDSDYLAKSNNDIYTWGADREIASASTKKGRNSGRTPFQILIAGESDIKNKDLFLEYVLTMRGKAQLFWSQGLKGKVGILDKTDEEIAEEKEEVADVLVVLQPHHWRAVVLNKARSEILDIAECRGFEGLQEWFFDYGLILDRPLFNTT